MLITVSVYYFMRRSLITSLLSLHLSTLEIPQIHIFNLLCYVGAMSDGTSIPLADGFKPLDETHHLDLINTTSVVNGKPNYYEKGGLRTEGDGMDHTHYNSVSPLISPYLQHERARELTITSFLGIHWIHHDCVGLFFCTGRVSNS